MKSIALTPAEVEKIRSGQKTQHRVVMKQPFTGFRSAEPGVDVSRSWFDDAGYRHVEFALPVDDACRLQVLSSPYPVEMPLDVAEPVRVTGHCLTSSKKSPHILVQYEDDPDDQVTDMAWPSSRQLPKIGSFIRGGAFGSLVRHRIMITAVSAQRLLAMTEREAILEGMGSPITRDCKLPGFQRQWMAKHRWPTMENAFVWVLSLSMAETPKFST